VSGFFEPQAFLQNYWQKAPSFLADGLSPGLPEMEPDELAWLATQADVESRLIFTETSGETTKYRLENGPFSAATLNDLPPDNWTLLVHDVEKHLPDFRAWLDQAKFIPDWRIDDLMISCAAPGGSVGPHVDNYDVFLCQGSGRRRWSTGRPGDAEVDDRQTGLSLLKPFPLEAQFEAAAGDVLYLPPGVPHWGIAHHLCITLSVGCRAPSRRELQLGQERVLGRAVRDRPGADDRVLYKDPDLDVAESGPGRVDVRTIERVRDQRLLDERLSDGEIARIFGSVVTDPKAWLEPEPMRMPEFEEQLRRAGFIDVHGMARIAWMDLPGDPLVFVNGIHLEVTAHVLEAIRNLCSRRRLTAVERDLLGSLARGEDALTWLVSSGLFDAGHSLE